jgi:hypothetical protein
MIGFSWIEEKDEFTPLHHQKKEPILSLKLTHKEGEISILDIELPYEKAQAILHSEEPYKQWAYLSYQHPDQETPQCLFKGWLAKHPQKCQGETLCLRFYGSSPKTEQIQKNLLKNLGDSSKNLDIFPDPLFFKTNQTLKIEDFLQNQPKVLFIDPIEHAIKTIDLFQGTHTIHLDRNFLWNTLKVEVNDPVDRINLLVSAQWTQRQWGFLNLSSYIKKLFPEKIVNTYSGSQLMKTWPKEGKRLGKSGYRIIHGNIRRIVPPFQKHDSYERSLFLPHEKSNICLERSWFDTNLIVGWDFHRKRHETITIALESKLLPIARHKTKSKTIHLNLDKLFEESTTPFWYPNTYYHQSRRVRHDNNEYLCAKDHVSDVCFNPLFWEIVPATQHVIPEVKSSFFLTKRGQQAFEYALDRAKVHLFAGARQLKVRFTGGWKELAQANSSTSILLTDPLLPGGQAQGKIVEISLQAEGKTGRAIVEVTLALSLSALDNNVMGQAEENPNPSDEISNLSDESSESFSYGSDEALDLSDEPEEKPTNTPYVDEEYVEESYCYNPLTTYNSPQKISYYPYHDQSPQDPYAKMGFMLPHEMIKQIKLINGPLEQERTMTQWIHDQGSHITHEFKKHMKSWGPLKSLGTSIHLEMQRINPSECYRHTITVRSLGPVLIPKATLDPTQE